MRLFNRVSPLFCLGGINLNGKKYIAEYETDVAIIKVRLNNSTDITREQVFKRISQASYNLCLHEHERKMKSSNEG